jgi:putative resolvase
VRVESEIGSGMDGSCSKARWLLADANVTRIVVEPNDCFGWMNVELVEAALAAHGRRVVVGDEGEAPGDLVRDMRQVPTLLCARLYGRGSARTRAGKALEAARHG